MNYNNKMIVCILAAGLGKRMKTDLPKCLNLITNPNNKDENIPMIIY